MNPSLVSALRAYQGARTEEARLYGLEGGAIDELLVHVAPVLLGDGVRLFGHPGGTRVRFERVSCTHAAKVTNLWLRAMPVL